MRSGLLEIWHSGSALGSGMMASFFGLWLFVAVGIQTVAVSTGCGGYFYADQGYITSPNYPRNYSHNIDCSWYITAPLGSVVHLVFLDFAVQHHESCNFDFVNVYDRSIRSSSLVAHKCGMTLPSPQSYKSTSNSMSVRFYTDASVSAQGFRAMYFVTDTSCGGLRTGNNRAILSPGFPFQYGANMNCGWMLITPTGSVDLKFQFFDVEDHTSCSSDYVDVYNGLSLARLGKYCGPSIPPTVASGSKYMLVRFRSDRIAQKNGFIAVFY